MEQKYDRKMSFLNQFEIIDIKNFLKFKKMKIVTVLKTKGYFRVVVEITEDKSIYKNADTSNENGAFIVRIPFTQKNQETPFTLLKGGQSFSLENIGEIENISVVYSNLTITAKGIEVIDKNEKTITLGIFERNNQEKAEVDLGSDVKEEEVEEKIEEKKIIVNETDVETVETKKKTIILEKEEPRKSNFHANKQRWEYE